MRRAPSLLTFLSLLMLLPGCKRSEPPTAGTPPAVPEGRNLTVKGSDTMVLLGQRWAAEFMKQNAQASLQVTGGGSGTGIAALINGTTDIAMSSRAIKPAEAQKVQAQHKTEAREIPVARDGVTFYVHESNPVRALSVAQLKGIYLGDITRWKDVGGQDAPIVLYSRENSSGTYVFVKEHVLGNEDFSPSTLSLPGTAAVVNAVSKEKNGIGYGGAAYAKGIRELSILQGAESIAPSAENIQTGHYPLSRDLFFYVRGAPQGTAQAFIDFALSPQGQQLVTQVGYYPLKPR
ncbi:phosphate ABC transporter substrate-binding protein [Stigmatella aurantiaca]|uniref:Phosphate-binding protein n=1 Tax=Stigmatella aurantiaca (strain DW4/3-1) TaxID=378806 RepID=Q08TR3_STIAD|nr:phosphate ABC transporter substrate-binding protein [Stigmatella aurantiaca]ADO71956.1 Phosphate ABC transporter, periplasmic phosphate-binding protein [Stigmatella aurantiaca DW4/3-1]EAU63883.1 phosphate-binding protein [Stigmatella aurantiaca DW4/3-1]